MGCAMNIRVEIQNLDKLMDAFGRAPGEVKRQLRLALLVALRNVKEYAQRVHRFRTRSGSLERSIESEVTGDWPPTGRVWLNPATTMTKSGKSYGAYVHEGTPPHDIRPVNRKALRWAAGNAFVFSKKAKHPGTPKDQFVYQAAEAQRPNINSVFERYTDIAIRKAGL